jgi:hypothetical protein
MRIVDLGFCTDGKLSREHFFGIVIPWNSGVIWSHSVGGKARAEMSAEGLFIPLPGFMSPVSQKNLPGFREDPLHGYCGAYDINLVEQFFGRFEYLNHLFEPYTTGQLPPLAEAWVAVRVKRYPEGYWARMVEPFSGYPGFIVYANSD